jgi:hypothetical protein
MYFAAWFLGHLRLTEDHTRLRLQYSQVDKRLIIHLSVDAEYAMFRLIK